MHILQLANMRETDTTHSEQTRHLGRQIWIQVLLTKKKAVAVVCSLKRALQVDPSLPLNETILPVKQEHTFLGTTIYF